MYRFAIFSTITKREQEKKFVVFRYKIKPGVLIFSMGYGRMYYMDKRRSEEPPETFERSLLIDCAELESSCGI